MATATVGRKFGSYTLFVRIYFDLIAYRHDIVSLCLFLCLCLCPCLCLCLSLPVSVFAYIANASTLSPSRTHFYHLHAFVSFISTVSLQIVWYVETSLFKGHSQCTWSLISHIQGKWRGAWIYLIYSQNAKQILQGGRKTPEKDDDEDLSHISFSSVRQERSSRFCSRFFFSWREWRWRWQGIWRCRSNYISI